MEENNVLIELQERETLNYNYKNILKENEKNKLGNIFR